MCLWVMWCLLDELDGLIVWMSLIDFEVVDLDFLQCVVECVFVFNIGYDWNVFEVGVFVVFVIYVDFCDLLLYVWFECVMFVQVVDDVGDVQILVLILCIVGVVCFEDEVVFVVYMLVDWLNVGCCLLVLVVQDCIVVWWVCVLFVCVNVFVCDEIGWKFFMMCVVVVLMCWVDVVQGDGDIVVLFDFIKSLFCLCDVDVGVVMFVWVVELECCVCWYNVLGGWGWLC